MALADQRNVAAAAKHAALRAFGGRLQRARGKGSFTQETVADRLGVSTQTIRNWEAGRTEPGQGDKDRLAELYNTPVDELIGTDEPDLSDPELSLFFRGEWSEFNEEEREFLKGLIRESRELLRRRRERSRSTSEGKAADVTLPSWSQRGSTDAQRPKVCS